MAYLNDVTSLVYGDEDKFVPFIVSYLLIEQNKLLEFFKYDLSYAKSNYYKSYEDNNNNIISEHYVLQLTIRDVKWGDGIEYTDCWNRFCEAARNAGLTVEFIRIGEGIGDIEENSDADSRNYIYHETSIISEFSNVLSPFDLTKLK